VSILTGNTTRQFSTPYLTVDEYKQAPTAIDYNNLVVASADPAVQDAELANVIARASSWIDTYCNQIIGATQETEQQRSRLRSDGMLIVHPRYFPVVALTAFSFGVDPNGLVNYPDPSLGWIEDQSIVLPYTSANLSYSSQGPLQFGMPAIPRSGVYCRYTYVSGYANTLINATVSSGATSITVADATGITAGTRLTIFNGLSTETVTVASTYSFGSTTVPLVTATAYAHASGISISSLPPAVKEAAILATTAFIKVRGDTSLVMDVISTPMSQGTQEKQGIANDLGIARELLMPFRRIR
jgi:hypothetical protein